MGLRERRREERMARTRKKVWNVTVIVVLVCVAAGCIGYLTWYNWDLRQKESAYEDMRVTEALETSEMTEEIIIEETEREEKIYCESSYDFSELQAQNEDIYAWITVPGTQIDYPVLQSDTDNYYLDYNLNHTKGYPGCIYTNQCNAKDFSDYNTVLYGHNMKNGTMFGSLHSFEDEDFFEENDKIYVYTEDRRLTYEIYASIKFTDQYIPAYYDVATEEGKESFLSAILAYSDDEVSHVREGMEIASGDTLITLSTCVSGESDRRYLVVGKLVEEAWYYEPASD